MKFKPWGRSKLSQLEAAWDRSDSYGHAERRIIFRLAVLWAERLEQKIAADHPLTRILAKGLANLICINLEIPIENRSTFQGVAVSILEQCWLFGNSLSEVWYGYIRH